MLNLELVKLGKVFKPKLSKYSTVELKHMAELWTKWSSGKKMSIKKDWSEDQSQGYKK